MKYDIILAGVGGQGVLSLSAIIATAAMKEGLQVKQSEVHGMAQRGGAVISNLRLSDETIESDLIPYGTASMILSMEPLESLRYLYYLSPKGTMITAIDPVLNIPDYPNLDELIARIKAVPNAIALDAKKFALEAGSPRATNTVMLGCAAGSLPMKPETLREVIGNMFKRKGDKIVEANMKAFDLGRQTKK